MLPVPYRIVEDALIAQVFIGPAQTVRVFEGQSACNTLTLSEARVESGGRQRVRVLTTLTAHVGTPLAAGQCLFLFDWTGVLETNEEPYLVSGRVGIGFRVVDSNILDRKGKRASVPGVVWAWVKQYAHPRLAGVVLDLAPALGSAREFVQASTSDAAVGSMFDSLRIKAVVAAAETLNVQIALTVPPIPADWRMSAPEPALTEDELERLRNEWQIWEGFATWLIKTVAADADESLTTTLGAALLDGRHDLVTILSTDSTVDPVPGLFVKTWTRLAPPFLQLATRVPGGADALRYLGFISAAETWRTLQAAAPQLGLMLDANALRRLARTLLPTVDDSALAYSIAVDPGLRALLGFEPEFSQAGNVRQPWWWQIVPSAEAASGIDPALSQRLSGWVPESADLDQYLTVVARLFEQLASVELGRGKVQPPYAAVYQTLLRATAWQETCWRQYVLKDHTVQTIRSVSGSVGIMQVNTHVWRGIYDLQALLNDVGYNARAGNEILVHYLVDFAIRKREHEAPGGIDNLARASYAIYNGGPGHLKRYRIRGTNEGLRKIDAAFWKKYLALKSEGVASGQVVKECYGS